MAATSDREDDLEAPHPFPVASKLPTNTSRFAASAVLSLYGFSGIRKSTIDMKKKKTTLRISSPAPTHHVRAIFEQKIAVLEEEVNLLRNWWWVDMMDRPTKRDWGQDGRWSEIYKREHWVRGLELAANGWVEADFAREKMMHADMREKEREARRAKEAEEKAKQQLATARIELTAVKRELEEKKEQDAIDRQLALTMLAGIK